MREMKDSGIEWIGAIPEEWKCCKQKYVIRLINGRAYSESEFEENGKYIVLRVGNLFSNPVWYTSSLELEPEKYCEHGDLLYSWSMSYAPVIWTGEKAIFHYHIWKVELKPDVDKKFGFYYLIALTDALKAEIHETTMGFITMGIMNNSYIAFPNISMQKNIALFLDCKCAEIDTLTSDIETQIETLEQYKRSVITEAVTKGLDPDAEMKDSGVEFVGDIPNGWEIRRIKTLGTARNGLTYSPMNICDENEGVLVLRSSNIQNGEIDLDDNVFVKARIPVDLMVKEGDILICSRNGSVKLIGKNALIPPNICATFGAFMMIFRTEYSKYMYYVLNSSVFDYYLGTFVTSTINQLTQTNYKNMKVPFCMNQFEREEIVDYLDRKCAEIDSIIADKRTQLDTLAEYKKSLIYEYVTGKKEVPSVNETNG